MKKTSFNSPSKITNFVKRRMWDNDVQATTRCMRADCVQMQERWNVFCTVNSNDVCPGWADFMALVTDYGDHKRVKFFTSKGKQIDNFLRVHRTIRK